MQDLTDPRGVPDPDVFPYQRGYGCELSGAVARLHRVTLEPARKGPPFRAARVAFVCERHYGVTRDAPVRAPRSTSRAASVRPQVEELW
jgi:hypothetical protein